jgi:hypothetical protein
MNLNSVVQLLKIITCSCLFFFLTSNNVLQGQTTKNDLFKEVSPEKREQLTLRLQALIEYQRSHQWDKHYDLLATTYTQGMDKNTYISVNTEENTQANLQLISFTPSHISIDSTGLELILSGCGQFNDNGKLRDLESVVIVCYQNNNWYFTPVSLSLEMDGDPISCKKRKTNKGKYVRNVQKFIK